MNVKTNTNGFKNSGLKNNWKLEYNQLHILSIIK